MNDFNTHKAPSRRQFAAGLALAVPAASIAPAAFAEANAGGAGASRIG